MISPAAGPEAFGFNDGGEADPFVSKFVKMMQGGAADSAPRPAPVDRYTDPSQGMGSPVVEKPEDPLATLIAGIAGVPYAANDYYWTGAE